MMPLHLRLVRPDDQDFLFQVYASTRAEEMALVNWDAAQQHAFLQMQFNAQTQHYRIQYPHAEYSIILRDQAAIGRLIVNRADDEIMLMDIALLPEYRNVGLGTALICDFMDEARSTRKPLRLHVETYNPAQRLYERLGFVNTSETGIYRAMEWTAESAPSERPTS
jgi:ribosomal protein S18 acetylase RimI-like enzyme